jgi:hypothetical protein
MNPPCHGYSLSLPSGPTTQHARASPRHSDCPRPAPRQRTLRNQRLSNALRSHSDCPRPAPRQRTLRNQRLSNALRRHSDGQSISASPAHPHSHSDYPAKPSAPQQRHEREHAHSAPIRRHSDGHQSAPRRAPPRPSDDHPPSTPACLLSVVVSCICPHTTNNYSPSSSRSKLCQ